MKINHHHLEVVAREYPDNPLISSPLGSRLSNISESIKTTIALKLDSFVSSSASSSSSSSTTPESEKDFVAIDQKDFDSIGSPTLHLVSLLIRSYAQLLCSM